MTKQDRQTTGPLPQRVSLVHQVVEILLKKLRAGELTGVMPSERRLCRELQVSRKTLRAALVDLQRGGQVRVSGSGRRVVSGRATRIPARRASKKVVLIGAKPMRVTEQFSTLVIEELERRLHRAGLELAILINPRFAHADCARSVARLRKQTRAAGWVLWGVHPLCQKWFPQQGEPAMVFGLSPSGSTLPSVDLDYAAVIQHAVDLLVARGHRSLVLLCERSAQEGDLLTEQEFRARFAGRHTGIEHRIVHHNGSVTGIRQALNLLFQRGTRPTALIVPYAFSGLAVLGHLAQMGIRVPDDVSVVLRDDDSCLAFSVPPLSRYTADPVRFAWHLSRIAIRLAGGESARSTSVRIMPQFVPGESVRSRRR